MKTNLIKMILAVIALLSVKTVFSQSIKYPDFIKLANIERWAELNDSLIAKKYIFSGTLKPSNNSHAYWTKYCTIKFDSDGKGSIISDNSYGSYEVLEVGKYEKDKGRTINYLLSSKRAFDSFLRSAEEDGFDFYSDIIQDNNIMTKYLKYDSISDKLFFEILRFTIGKDDRYMIEYEKRPSIRDNDKQNKVSEKNNPTNTSEQKQLAEKKKREEEAAALKKKKKEETEKKRKLEAEKKRREEAAEKKRKEEAEKKNREEEERKKQYSKSNRDHKKVKEIRAFRYQHLAALDGKFKELESHPTSGTIVIGNTDEGEWVIVGVAGTELSGKVVKRNPTEKPDKNHEIQSCLFGSDYEGQRVALVLDEYYDTSTSKLVPEKVILSILNPKTAETTVAFLFTKITRAR